MIKLISMQTLYKTNFDVSDVPAKLFPIQKNKKLDMVKSA